MDQNLFKLNLVVSVLGASTARAILGREGEGTGTHRRRFLGDVVVAHRGHAAHWGKRRRGNGPFRPLLDKRPDG